MWCIGLKVDIFIKGHDHSSPSFRNFIQGVKPNFSKSVGEVLRVAEQCRIQGETTKRDGTKFNRRCWLSLRFPYDILAIVYSLCLHHGWYRSGSRGRCICGFWYAASVDPLWNVRWMCDPVGFGQFIRWNRHVMNPFVPQISCKQMNLFDGFLDHEEPSDSAYGVKILTT